MLGSLAPAAAPAAARPLPAPNEGGPPQVEPAPRSPVTPVSPTSSLLRSAVPAEPTIRGYAKQLSVKQGDVISFAFSSMNAAAPVSYPMSIIRLGRTDVVYNTGTAVISARKINTANDLAQDWPTTFSVRIGSRWQSGIYVARPPTFAFSL
jgi:hypothetical protein